MKNFQFITNSKGEKKNVTDPIDQYNSFIDKIGRLRSLERQRRRLERLERLEKLKILEEVDLFTLDKNDPTKMTKEEYFSMIDEARKGEKKKMSREEMKKLLIE